ncbi:MAG: hypothetical protein P1V51_01095 [Deltaproteobacteria bacterium]|nr:hypothetical protein [Deltaproteobacteria bacterium]
MNAALLLLLLGAAAGAPTADPYGPRDAVHLPPLAIHAFGGMLEYERYALPEQHLSLALRAGLRSAAREDFRGLGLSAGAELRLWPAQRLVAFKPAPEVMAGPYLGLALDLEGSGLRATTGEKVGSHLAFGLTALGGYRLLTGFGPVATIFVGAVLQRSLIFDGRTAGLTILRPAWGFTLGWVF